MLNTFTDIFGIAAALVRSSSALLIYELQWTHSNTMRQTGTPVELSPVLLSHFSQLPPSGPTMSDFVFNPMDNPALHRFQRFPMVLAITPDES